MDGADTVPPSSTVCWRFESVSPSITKLTTYILGVAVGVAEISGEGVASAAFVTSAEGVGFASATGAGVEASAGASEPAADGSLAGVGSLAGAGSLAGCSLLTGAGSLAGAAVSVAAAASSASVLVGSSASTISTHSVKLKIRFICDHFIKFLPPRSITCGSRRVSISIKLCDCNII